MNQHEIVNALLGLISAASLAAIRSVLGDIREAKKEISDLKLVIARSDGARDVEIQKLRNDANAAHEKIRDITQRL